jgi:glucose-6-phosphate 1-dehydrogenase
MTASFIPVEPFDLVVFGGTGDLAMRKILPGLYHRDLDGQLPAESRIVGAARTETDRDGYVAQAEKALRRFIEPERMHEEKLASFLARLDYLPLDATRETGWLELAGKLGDAPDRIRVFYLATAPDLFGPVCRKLGSVGVATPNARVVLEKPVGRDLASAHAINAEVGEVFQERQIFRIDHYLGKETVQNLMALRFANTLFEPLWNHAGIDNVQITVAETVGLETRAAYYDRSGALRDMVQNHILQLLCLVAMEPPAELAADAVRDEKLKVLRSLAPIVDGAVAQKTVRGQYRAGAVNGQAVRGYLEELGGPNESQTETFVAIKAEVRNWRWAGVPFYLRTGKRLPARVSEIVVQFKPLPHSIFPKGAGAIHPNRLIIRLQPDEGIRLLMMSKDPGPGGIRLKQTPLNLSFAEAFAVRAPDAYERLLLDVVRGNATLFMRKDEVEAAWAWVDPIIAGWAEEEERSPCPYPAGSWGPTESVALTVRDGRTWFDATL